MTINLNVNMVQSVTEKIPSTEKSTSIARCPARNLYVNMVRSVTDKIPSTKKSTISEERPAGSPVGQWLIKISFFKMIWFDPMWTHLLLFIKMIWLDPVWFNVNLLLFIKMAFSKWYTFDPVWIHLMLLIEIQLLVSSDQQFRSHSDSNWVKCDGNCLTP